MLSKLFAQIMRHKFAAGTVLLLVAGGGYFGYAKIFSTDGVVRYATAQVQKGTLVVSITGSGQVSASNQVDIKPKASGDIVYVGVKNGQEVKAGTLIAQIDSRDAQKAVRDAQANVESARLTLEKLRKPADALSILQAENSLAQAKDNATKLKLSQEIEYQKAVEAKQKAQDDLKKAYEDGFNTAANAFLDLPNIITGLQDILFGTSFNASQSNLYYYSDAVKSYDEKVNQYRDDANNGYQTARAAYDKNFDDYKSASRFSDTATIERLIDQTYDTSKNIAQAVKSAANLIQFYQDKLTERNLKPNALSNTHLSTLNTYTGKTNIHLLNLLSTKSTIQTDKETILNAERDISEMNQNNPLNITSAEQSIKEKEEFFAKLKAGPDALDIQSAELTIKQRKNAFLDAQEKLADYFIRPPFDGVAAKVNVKKGDSVSSGVVAATLITKQKLAEISLNEVDAGRRHLCDKNRF
ncbi:MAG: biotin/lipoyl-binding protein [Candidatus Portnoybacteria bacterium]|nr:biotin/lipoyl-binding protein [Candidatus Portnoybacteria bacterium]